MQPRSHPLRRLLAASFVGLAALMAGVAWLAYILRESAVAVVADTNGIGIVAGGLALALAAIGHLLVRGIATRVSRGVDVAVALAAVLGLGLLLSGRFLAFRTEEVRIPSDDAVLAGTLYEPRGDGPHPGVVLLHGSGPERRDEYAFYARYFARRGISAVVYDKRGAGESTGRLYAAGYGDYAADALAAVRMLALRPRIDANRVGLVGFSEAEWVAPVAAARSDRIAFVALVGASGLRPSEQVGAEMSMRLRRFGHADSVVVRALALNERVFAYQRSGEGADALNAALQAARTESWFRDAEDLPEEVGTADERTWLPWWRAVMDFDSDSVWQQVSVPVLLLKGGRDDRSSPGPMRHRIAAALRKGGNAGPEVRIFPEADHMMLEWPRGEGSPPPVFTDGFLDELVGWIDHVPARSGTPDRP